MNSSLVHRMVQLVLSFVQWNVYDEAFLELDSMLLNNLDLDLNRRFVSSLFKHENVFYLLQYVRKELLAVQIMTRYVDYVHDVHQVIEEDLEVHPNNLHGMEHLRIKINFKSSERNLIKDYLP